ncbi:CobW family GTP-binding protein [Halobacillus massiliensis]|uniref:CobW family GTP-binding protein n=1 Tax=Halobacillus massiliensis TaxID=1926286 RepID=UPI0009E2EF0D|nr:GTP-binding protein [Halobacillus massiliensis]
MKHTEINILSGFLGSGKTTLLQQLLKLEKERKREVGVIMNEAGEISIDSHSLPNHSPLKELLNGCVCCTLSGKLESQIADILFQYDLDVIYIETTGVAHPVEVLDACLTPYLSNKIKIGSIISMVDPNSWTARHKMRGPLRKLITEQVKHADIILNKTDQLKKKHKEKIIEQLESINSNGRIIPAKFAEVPQDTLFNIERIQPRDHDREQTIDHLHIKTYVYKFSCPIDYELLEEFLQFMPDQIFRIKGFIRLNGQKETYLFQYAYGMPNLTPSPLKLDNNLVFIGDNLDHSLIEEKLKTIEKMSVHTSRN